MDAGECGLCDRTVFYALCDRCAKEMMRSIEDGGRASCDECTCKMRSGFAVATMTVQ